MNLFYKLIWNLLFKILSIVNLLYHKENCLVTSSHSLKQISCNIYIYKTKGLTHAKDPNAINWNKNWLHEVTTAIFFSLLKSATSTGDIRYTATWRWNWYPILVYFASFAIILWWTVPVKDGGISNFRPGCYFM
jgi:hypothetical protein